MIVIEKSKNFMICLIRSLSKLHLFAKIVFFGEFIHKPFILSSKVSFERDLFLKELTRIANFFRMTFYQGRDMKSFESTIKEMNQLLTDLVQVATQLYQASLQVINEEELVALQQTQEELLKQLETVDHHLHQHYHYQVEPAMHEHFHQQLQQFQQLNQEFLQNLATSHGLIQFELRQLQDNEDFPKLSRRNEIFSKPLEKKEEAEENKSSS